MEPMPRRRFSANPQDKPATPMTHASLKPENKIFGRRFILKSFRWLSPNEI